MSALRTATSALLIGLLTTVSPAAPGDWHIERADCRVLLFIDGDLYRRERPHFETVINFGEFLGAHRTLRANSLALVEATGGAPIPLALAEDAQLRYMSGNPILRLSWDSEALGAFEQRSWWLYMATTRPGAPDAWEHIGQTFLPRPGDLLFTSDIEMPNPARPQVPLAFHPGGRDQPGETTERVWSDEGARSGGYALKLARTFDDAPPKNSNRPFWWTWPPPVQVSEGHSLRLSAWIKSVWLGRRSFASVALEFRDADRKRLGNRLWLRGAQQPHGWTRLTGSVTAPPGAASAVFWFSLHGQGEAYCDDVRVARVPGSTLPALSVETGSLETRPDDATAPVERKTLRAAVAREVPALDGTLDDPCWQAAQPVDDLEPFILIPRSQSRTQIRVCANREALYFGFDCYEPTTDELVADAAQRDGPVWRDDSVELFLDTNLDRHSYYQVIINPKGVFFDQDTGAPDLVGPDWDGPIEVATKVLPDRWTAEVRLALTGLRLAQGQGRTWGANFARTSLRGGRSAFTWVGVSKGFGEPDRFGDLLLPFDPGENAVTGRATAGSRLFWGDGALPFEISNRRKAPVEVRLMVTDEGSQQVLGRQRLNVGARSTVQASPRCLFPTPGPVRLRYDLLHEPDGAMLYTASQEHTIPPPLELSPLNLLSYLEEDTIAGRYSLGLCEEALHTATVTLALLAHRTSHPGCEKTIHPEGGLGSFELDVRGLPAGRYELKARLLQADRELAIQRFTVVRLRGPFSP